MKRQEQHSNVFGKTVKPAGPSTIPRPQTSKRSNVPFPAPEAKYSKFPLRKGQK